jgi:hypothetical protein
MHAPYFLKSFDIFIMKKLLIATLFISGVISFTSCTKEEEPEEKNTAVITITDPIVDSHLHHLDTLKIRGTIISTMDMHGYSASIRRTDTDAEVFFFDDHYHGQNKVLNIDWPCNLNESTQLELILTALLDHEGNATIKTVDFYCEP